MNSIYVSILLLILISSIITITVQDSNATSKADKITEGAKDVKKNIEEGLDKLRAINNKYNDNQNIKNEFDDSEDTSSENNNNNGKKVYCR